MLNEQIQNKMCDVLGERHICNVESFKTVWSGFGSLQRISFGPEQKTIVVKSISIPNKINHPKGWSSDFASERKLKSYRVEQVFYRQYAAHINVNTPRYLGFIEDENTQYLLLSDLAQEGFHEIAEQSVFSVKQILVWLANFHAQNLYKCPANLWPQGSYWHLATRPNEFNAMSHIGLKESALELDIILQSCEHQTLIHGDAKIANFMQAGNSIVGYDFQYVGGGVGIIDVMLLISSAFTSEQCYKYEEELLQFYKQAFLDACERFSVATANHVIDSWLALYPVAWADFARFLDGWSPGHWKLHNYAWYQVEKALKFIG